MGQVIKADFITKEIYWVTIVKEDGGIEKREIVDMEDVAYRAFRTIVDNTKDVRYALMTTFDRSRIIGEYHIINGHS